jgi:hypothetical protein
MKYEIVPLEGKLIKVLDKNFDQVEIGDTLVIQIAERYGNCVDEYLEELQRAFPDKNIVVTTSNVRFCTLKEVK